MRQTLQKQPKAKKCKQCRTTFNPDRQLQSVCSPKCGLDLAAAKREKDRIAFQRRERREIKERKEKLKSRPDHLKEAQHAFNEYIRLRDADKPCISCDRHHAGKYDAGHYRSVGACPELRFDEDNVHKQCSPCNTQLSGNILEYRIRLIQRIGADRVARLEGKHEPLKLSVEQIKALKAHFRAKVRELKRGAA
ncbi:recombination protein NinG [Pseudomonas sp. GD04087]|uniref:recombination protein NinG n=1 Tax=unclassified Pseudomonas TaxID=196821 RepID=UPI0024498212|nr:MULTISPECIES: recombination protein NinG [unclassified Pseudomonas]MDH0293391.1 recombination protein NinG [Pseudomonas sp. GD04087]MDH1053014.1 recombination protein NinG [Pseudomonas sp. GD03903]MDH2003576.1 recombination protein NinG [Pseudomonas sp. GD03691]